MCSTADSLVMLPPSLFNWPTSNHTYLLSYGLPPRYPENVGPAPWRDQVPKDEATDHKHRTQRSIYRYRLDPGPHYRLRRRRRCTLASARHIVRAEPNQKGIRAEETVILSTDNRVLHETSVALSRQTHKHQLSAFPALGRQYRTPHISPITPTTMSRSYLPDLCLPNNRSANQLRKSLRCGLCVSIPAIYSYLL